MIPSDFYAGVKLHARRLVYEVTIRDGKEPSLFGFGSVRIL